MSLIFACLAAVAVDGDTLRCANLPDQGGRVRIARIDTPERGEPGFEEAKRALAAMIDGRVVRCELVDADPRIAGFQERDRFGRPVARCSAGGRDLGEAQLAARLAVVWPRGR
jgi:micrococcal nuclease